RRTRSAPTALELTAETFAEVVLQCHRGARVAEPTGWLFTIAQSKLADLHRRGAVDARARRRLGMPAAGAEDEALERVEALLDEPRSTVLADALAELPDEQRQAVLARVVQERSYEHIAADLETTEQVVRKRVSRGLALLRRRLKEMS